MNVAIVMRAVRTAEDAEAVHGLARWLHANPAQSMHAVQTAVRAVRAKDPHVMRVLEQTTGWIERACEAQDGETRRASRHWWRPEHEEIQIWRNAAATAERGDPAEAYMFVYGAAAVFAGVVRDPR